MDRRTLLGSLVLGGVGAAMPGAAEAAVEVRPKTARSVRRWDDVLDLGDGRKVPMQRLFVEGVDPRTVRCRSEDGMHEVLVWSECEPNLDDLRGTYLWLESKQTSLTTWPPLDPNPNARLHLHPWWITVVREDGVAFHVATLATRPVSWKDIEITVDLDEFAS